MCSIGDDETDIQNCMTQESPQTSLSDNCSKCRTEKPSIVLRGKDVYCKNCFILNTTHKFKAELGKSKLIRPKDRVLIYHKLGHPSTALLHFLRTGLDLTTPKKLRFEPIILFVEDQYQLTLEERQTMLEIVNKEIEAHQFQQHFVSFVDYILNPQKISEIITTNNLNIKQNDGCIYSEVTGKKNSVTASKEWKSIYIRKLLIDAATFFKCKFIFTPEISVDIASNLLANISLGRYQIANDTGFVDDRYDAKIVRPLRQFDMKELAYYNTFNNIEPVSVRETYSNPFSSVQNLTSDFVKNLQKKFPATVSTVVRTGDKLIVNKNKSEKQCQLCKVSFENKIVLTAEEATKVSILVSQTKIAKHDFFENVMLSLNNQSDYCYVCHKLLQL